MEKSRIFQSILDNLADGIIVANERGNFLYWNTAAERIIGLPILDIEPEAWSGTYGFYLPDKVTPYPTQQWPLMKAMQGQSIDGAEIFMKNKKAPDGVWLNVSARPLVLADGEDTKKGGLIIFHDTTRRKRQEQSTAAVLFELQRNEEQYRTLVHNIPGVIYRCNPDLSRKMRFMTDTIAKVTGYSAEDFIQGIQSYAGLIYSQDKKKVESLLKEALVKKEPYVMEYRLLHQDGSVRWVYDKGQAVYGESAEALWLDGVIFDVSDRKAAEEAVIQKVTELARSNTEREQLELFAFIASHDLRQPLQRIMGFAELLAIQSQGTLDEKCKDSLERIRGAADRMRQLLDDLLSFTRATTKTISMEPVELERVIHDALQDLELRIKASGAQIEVGKLASVAADTVQMRQLFQNLISNAIKFVKKDQSPHVVISMAPSEDDFIEIQVKDEGIGFDEKDAERVFKPFERLHGSSEYEGSGLGLAICRKIVSRHGGNLLVRSSPGEGTTFTIRLPLVKKA